MHGLGMYAEKIVVNAWASISWTIGGVLTNLGFTAKPTFKLTPEYLDKVTAQTGKIALGANFVGAVFEVMTPLLEPDVDMIRKMTPWAGPSGSFRLLPNALGFDLYSKAALLRLRPLTVQDGTADQNILKAVPIGSLELVRSGAEHDVLPVIWRVFPDRAQLPALEFGWIGAVP